MARLWPVDDRHNLRKPTLTLLDVRPFADHFQVLLDYDIEEVTLITTIGLGRIHVFRPIKLAVVEQAAGSRDLRRIIYSSVPLFGLLDRHHTVAGDHILRIVFRFTMVRRVVATRMKEAHRAVNCWLWLWGCELALF